MRPLVALCVAGAVFAAAPAFADTMINTSNGQTYTTTATTTPPGYVAAPAHDTGPMAIITTPIRIVTAPVGMLFQPANGAVGSASGERLVPYNPHCFMQTDFTGRHTAMCGP